MFEVLVVDDEPIIADSLYCLLLRDDFIKKNCEVHKAYNAFEAQFIVENEGIDLVLSDVNMPNLDGISFRNKLLAEGKECSFIFISGYSDFNNIYLAMKIPDTRFLLKSEPDEVIIKAVIEQLSLLQSKQSNKKDKEPEIQEDTMTKSAKNKFVKEIDDFLTNHLKDEACLKAVADFVNMSPPYLSRLYKELTGVNFSNRLCQLKIDKAKYYLSNTKKKVYEISSEVGFVAPSAFVYFFKKNTGMTPQQYRNQY